MRVHHPDIWQGIVVHEDHEDPLYLQLYTQLRRLILDGGGLASGARLPSSRALAARLGVSRNTVSLAYQRLQEDGHVRGRAGGGTIVSDRVARPSGRPSGRAPRPSERAEPAGAFPVHVPPVDLFPTQWWARLLGRRLRTSGERLLVGGHRLGLPELRTAIAAYLGVTRGLPCRPEQIVVTRGTVAAVELVARGVLEAGDVAWYEDPGDPVLRGLLAWNGARIEPVPVDDAGLDVRTGIRSAPRARLALVSAAHQLPWGAALSAERRELLLRHAREQRMCVIDVERDGAFLASSAPPPLWSEAPDSPVVHVGGFESVLFPQLHVGYCVLPPDLVDPVGRVAAETDVGACSVTQAALADLLEHHRFAGVLRRMTEACDARRAALLDALGELYGNDGSDGAWAGSAHGGGFVTILPPRGVPATTSPRTRGVSPTPGGKGGPGTALPPTRLEHYRLTRPGPSGFVLGCGSLREDRIRPAVRAWAAVLAHAG